MIYLFLIFILAICGIINASFLLWQHVRMQGYKKKMICPVGFQCSDVVESKFGKTFGVKNEIWGIFYYIALIGLLGFLIFDITIIQYVKEWMLLLGTLGFLGSLYFLCLQAFVIKKYCFWCLIAILINTTLFVLELLYFIS